LKKQRNYSPVGEIDRALDLLYREQSMKGGVSPRGNAAGANANTPVLKLQVPQAQAAAAAQNLPNEDDQIAAALRISKQDALSFVRQKSQEQRIQATVKPKASMEEEKKAAKPQLPEPENSGIEVAVSANQVSNAYAWGDNRYGQLGVSSRADFITSPTFFTQKLAVAKIECGADHTLCLTKSARVYFWGQYFLNSRKGEQVRCGLAREPKLVESLADHVIVDIACGTGHNLALTEKRKVFSWGTGCQGELGLGPNELGNF